MFTFIIFTQEYSLWWLCYLILAVPCCCFFPKEPMDAHSINKSPVFMQPDPQNLFVPSLSYINPAHTKHPVSLTSISALILHIQFLLLCYFVILFIRLICFVVYPCSHIYLHICDILTLRLAFPFPAFICWFLCDYLICYTPISSWYDSFLLSDAMCVLIRNS
jgi:hypothetical protein